MKSPRLRIALLSLLVGFVLARPAPAQVAGVAVQEGGVAKGQVMGGIARLDFSGCTVSKSANTFSITCTGVAGNPAGSAGQLQFNSAGTAFGGVTKWTSNGTTTITGLATGILDLGALTMANVKFPTAATTGFLRVTTTTGALTSGEFTGDVSNTALATTVLATHLSSPLPKAQGGAGADMTNVTFPDTGTLATTATVPAAGSCTNQAVTALANGVAPTCTTLTSAYVNNTIALTGTDINTSNQVTATHLAAALPLLQGGTGQTTKAAAFDGLSPNTTRGDLTYRGASNNIRLGVGTNGQCLVSDGTDPLWGSCATGSVGGSGTTGVFTKWSAINTIADTSLSESGTQLIYSGITGFSLTGSGTFLKALEGAAPTGAAGSDWLYGDSTAHRWKVKNNSNTADTLALFTDNLSVFAATTSAQLRGVLSDETGTGVAVFATSPTLVTPTLGVATATSVNGLSLTANATGFAVAGGTTSKTLTMSNTLTFSGTDSSSVAFGAGGTVAYTGGNLSQFAATTSAQLRGVLSDETGAGAAVFADTPTLITPVLGVATATSINKVAITAPASSATLTIADGKTLTVSNTMTLAGGDSSNITFPNATATALTTNAAVTIAQGGTGAATKAAAYDALNPNTTRGDLTYRGASNNVRLGVGTNGQCLTSNGTDPGWGSCSTGSVTTSGSPAAAQISAFTSATAITGYTGATVDSSGNVSVNSLTITGTSNGNLIGLPATTTSPTLVSSAANLIAPNASSMTAYGWRFPSTNAAGVLHVGTASGGISDLTAGTVALSEMANQAADTVVGRAAGTTGVPSAMALPTTGTNGCAGSADTLTYNTTTHAWGCHQIAGSGTVNSGTGGHLSYYATSTNAVSDMGTDFTWDGTHTLTGAAAAILDLTAMTPGNVKLPASMAFTTPDIGVAIGTSLNVNAGGFVGSSDTGTPRFTFSTNQITANRQVTFGVTTNQFRTGTSPNLTTFNFPASSGAVTVTGPNVTSGLLYAAGTAPAAGIATFDGSTFGLASTTTPNIGAATMTSLNKVAITPPTTAGTIAFGADNSTATLPNGIVPMTVAAGTAAMGTGAISSGTCAAAVQDGTVTVGAVANVATTDTITFNPNGDPSGVTGYAVSATGSVYIWAYPTSGHVNFKVCNNTAGSLTPSALTLNWRVTR